MKNKNDFQPKQLNEFTSDEQRQAFYRASIAQFQQLGYQEQYLAQLNDDLVPLTGIEDDAETA